jgi:hypothetical protein
MAWQLLFSYHASRRLQFSLVFLEIALLEFVSMITDQSWAGLSEPISPRKIPLAFVPSCLDHAGLGEPCANQLIFLPARRSLAHSMATTSGKGRGNIFLSQNPDRSAGDARYKKITARGSIGGIRTTHDGYR